MVSQDERIQNDVMRAASEMNEPSVSCSVEDGEVVLEGTASTDENSYRLEGIARDIPGVKSVRNSLMVEGFSATVGNVAEGIDLTPDFTAEAGTDDSLEATSEAEPYIPASDPVITTSADTADNVEVLNGFAMSSDDEGVEGNRATFPRGDAQLEELVEEALRLDASTTDLNVEVAVENGIVRLRGTVPSLDDAEQVESVAAGVPGVEEVLEELEIEGV